MRQKVQDQDTLLDATPVEDGDGGQLQSQDGIVVVRLNEEVAPVAAEQGLPLQTQALFFFRRYPLEIVMLALPMLFATLYYGLYMADQYVSETRFVVRVASAKSSGPISVLSQEKGLVRADEDSFLVNEFLRSRDAIAKLAKEDGLLPALTRPSADLFNAWPTMFSGSTREDLYEHFTKFITVDQNSSTGITTLKVRAFTPQDARRIANALVKHAEEVVNKLNDRALKQAVEFAMGIKNDAEERVIQAQARVTAFRNKEKTLDPGLQAVAVSEIVTKLTAERLSLQAALRETQLATPSSPRIPALENRLAAIDQQINQQRSLIVGASDSIVNSLAEYEKLMLKREMAARALSAALTSLEAAEQDAKRQKLYLERIVDANLPDKSTYPARLWTIFMWFAVSFAVYWIVKRVLAGIMQHGHT